MSNIKTYYLPFYVDGDQYSVISQISRRNYIHKGIINQYSLKFKARFGYKNGTPIVFQSNIINKIKQRLDHQINGNEEQQSSKKGFTFQFQNNNLYVIYAKKFFKNIISSEMKEKFLIQTKNFFDQKLLQMRSLMLKIFIFAGIKINKIKQPHISRKAPKQQQKIKTRLFIRQKLQKLQFQKGLQRIMSQDCVISTKNLFQSTMKVFITPKVVQKTEMTIKLRARNNPKKQQLQKKLIKQMSMLSDVINKQLIDMTDILYKNVDINKYSTNLFKILDMDEQSKVDLQIIGGVSIVQKINNAKLKIYPENQVIDEPIQQYHQQIAKKIFKSSSQMKNVDNSKRRFVRELDIIRYICQRCQKPKLYMPLYYYNPNNDEIYYSTWYPISLSSYLQTLKEENDKFQLDQVLQLCIQVVLIVIDLHASGVVHRDLKPSNFVVDVQGPRLRLKLIDFSQSMIIQNQAKQVLEQKLTVYSTPLYCPLQASTFSQQYKNQGLIKPQIDRWSVGVLIYEILNRYLPISYSSATLKDIHSLWPSEFLEHLTIRNNLSKDVVRTIIEFLTFRLLKVDQTKRLQLQKVLALLLLCKAYYLKILQLYLKQDYKTQMV